MHTNLSNTQCPYLVQLLGWAAKVAIMQIKNATGHFDCVWISTSLSPWFFCLTLLLIVGFSMFLLLLISSFSWLPLSFPYCAVFLQFFTFIVLAVHIRTSPYIHAEYYPGSILAWQLEELVVDKLAVTYSDYFTSQPTHLPIMQLTDSQLRLVCFLSFWVVTLSRVTCKVYSQELPSGSMLHFVPTAAKLIWKCRKQYMTLYNNIDFFYIPYFYIFLLIHFFTFVFIIRIVDAWVKLREHEVNCLSYSYRIILLCTASVAIIVN